MIRSVQSEEVLEILDVTDSKQREYVLNAKNAFLIDPKTIYLPNNKEGDILYIKYRKIAPELVSTTDNVGSTEFPLPNRLLRLLYALVALKVVRSIDGFKQLEGPIVNNYVRELEEAKQHSWALDQDMLSTLETKKGFY